MLKIYIVNNDLCEYRPRSFSGPVSPIKCKNPGGGGRLGFNFTRMCVSKSEGHGSFFGFK